MADYQRHLNEPLGRLPIVKAIFVLLALALASVGTTATVTTIQTAQEQAITQELRMNLH